jgi:hypothetical protein
MDWLRLWHDMPNDPKWRTIARISQQPIALVQALYLHLLVDASRNVTRGNADVTVEDLASALDADEAQIEAVLEAMQGRVLDGRTITGWDKRQPKRQDDSSERVRRHRAKKSEKDEKTNTYDQTGGCKEDSVTPSSNDGNACNAPVTQCNAPDKKRLDTESKDIAGSDDPAPDQTGDLLGDTSTPPTKKPRKPKSAYQLTRLGNGQYLYPDDFNRVWAKYPQRPAGDDKREAFEAFNARVTEGASLQEIEDGVDRYLAYVKANGNLGTDFVKRGKTFFGPSRWFEKPWTITATATPGQQNPRANPGREDRDAEIDRLLAEQGQGVGVTYEHE